MGIVADVEQILRASGKPYIAVDEAKKALFVNQRLKSFHYVVYFASGRNWLVWCGHLNPADKFDFKQWGEIFGDGFILVRAIQRKDGVVFQGGEGTGSVYFDLDGNGKVEPVYYSPTYKKQITKPAAIKKFVCKIPQVPMPTQAELITAGGAAAILADEKLPTVTTRGVQGSLLGERYEGSNIGSNTGLLFLI